jgi:hypothetical protein
MNHSDFRLSDLLLPAGIQLDLKSANRDSVLN